MRQRKMNEKYHVAKRKYILDVIASILGAIFSSGFLLSVLLEEVEEEVFELSEGKFIILIVFFLLALILQLIIYWMILRRHMFSDQDKSFLIEKGLFFKRRANIPYKNIHTISIKRRFVDLLLGLSTIEIDTGTTASFQAEGRLTLDKNYANVLKNYLENKKHDDGLQLPSPYQYDKVDKEKKFAHQMKWYHLMLMGVLKPGFLLAILFLTILLFGVGVSMMQLIEEVDIYQNYQYLIYAFFGGILLYLMVSMLYHLIKYYHYQYEIDHGYITYAYGLINKVEFKIPIKRINAVHINQSLLYRVFGFYQLNASILGIGELNDTDQLKSESKSILPFAKLDQVNKVLKDIGFYQDSYDVELKPKQFRYLNFMILPLILLVLVSAIPYFFIKVNLIILVIPIMVHLIVLMTIGLASYLTLKQHLISINRDVLLVQRGAFTVKRTIVNQRKIQMMSYRQSPILLIEKIGNIYIAYKDVQGSILMHNFSYENFMMLKNHFII